jgi:hypothetical protein
MRPIPVKVAKRIADSYGYDQVVVIARRVGDAPEPFSEHVTTYGRFLKHPIMGWPGYEVTPEMMREAFAHFPPSEAPTPTAKWEWFARRLNEAMRHPNKKCGCCGVTLAGHFYPDAPNHSGNDNG